jgi:hypothetical protein
MKFENGYMQPEVGDFVYKAYTPQSAGKVIRIIEGQMRTTTFKEPPGAEIKWINGTTTIENVLSLRDFRSLIADHEKKLETHKKTLSKLEDL